MTGYDLASQIKERLTAQEVVEFYGFHPNRSGFIKCPFHQGDRHASLKVYSGNKTGWHCFGCGAGGSVIDFVMKLFDIDFRQACVRINTDFLLGLTGERPSHAERSALLEARRRAVEKQEALEREIREKAEEHRYWWEVTKYFCPDQKDAEAGYIHPLYAEALKRLPYLEYWLDEHLGG